MRSPIEIVDFLFFFFVCLIAVANTNRTPNASTIIELFQRDILIKGAHSSIKRHAAIGAKQKLNDKNHS